MAKVSTELCSLGGAAPVLLSPRVRRLFPCAPRCLLKALSAGVTLQCSLKWGVAGVKPVALRGGPSLPPPGRTAHSREAGTLATLAGLEEAEVLVVLDLVRGAVVVAAGAAIYGSSGPKLNPPWGCGVQPSAGVRGAAGHGRQFTGVHSSRAGNGGQDGRGTPRPQTYFL